MSKKILLNHKVDGPFYKRLHDRMASLIIGQSTPIKSIARMYQRFKIGLSLPDRPIANLLLLGPTGSGKTATVEAFASAVFGCKRDMIRVDCAEFQHSHEIAKLIGSPPGYLGHKETTPPITQKKLASFSTLENPFTIILFDEIEKASDSLWNLLLGILDNGILTLGSGEKVSLTKTFIFMTSNLGAKEMLNLEHTSFGFVNGNTLQDDEKYDKIKKIGVNAAKKKFSPEFMNRLDDILVFDELNKSDIDKIFNLQIDELLDTQIVNLDTPFFIEVKPKAKELLVNDGYNPQYGARHLRRSIDRNLMQPVSNLVANQFIPKDSVLIVDEDGGELVFYAKKIELRSNQKAA